MPIFVGAASSSFANYPNVGVGTTTTTGRNAGIRTAIGELTYNVDTFKLEVFDGTNWIGGLSSPFSATGGTKDTTSRSGYAVHTFTGDGTFTVAAGSKPMTCEYVVVGGGGGAPGGFPNGACGGGGGAGGHQSGSTLTVTAGDYTIQVGGGGAGVTGNSSKPNTIGPMKGTPSFITNPGITSITALGGGGGAGYGFEVGDIQTDGVCGSGGGASQNPPSGPGGSGTTGQGNPGGLGGSSAPGPVGGGGGGGAGGAGGDGGTTSPPSGTGGAGGDGSANSITGSPVTRAGGGGGGGGWYHSGSPSYAGGLAGPGGGGAGGSGNGGGQGGAGTAGTANTGGGGGAGGAPGPGGGNSVGASGGSGIVIIAYPTS